MAAAGTNPRYLESQPSLLDHFLLNERQFEVYGTGYLRFFLKSNDSNETSVGMKCFWDNEILF